MKFLWTNGVQIAFGQNVVKEEMKRFVKPSSRVLCTFGGGSIDKNGARKDANEALTALHCEVRWEGGIPPNPEYERCMEIVAVVKQWKPDLLLAVGGGSTLDATKFISIAAKLPEGTDAYKKIMVDHEFPVDAYPIGDVMTLPATGSEWNNNFVVSYRKMNQKLGCSTETSYPKFSLLDPLYTMTLPPRQLRNGVWDAITHCLDQYLTDEESPLFDTYWMSTIKELVEIGPDVVKPNSSIELHERLIVAATFALNLVFTLGKPTCWGIHDIGHMLTARYGIDHGATLSIVAPSFYQNKHQFEHRKVLMAKTAEFVYGIHEGTVDEKAHAFIRCIQKTIADIGQCAKVTDWEGAKIEAGDVEKVTKMVMDSMGGQSFGASSLITEEDVRDILTRVIV